MDAFAMEEILKKRKRVSRTKEGHIAMMESNQ